ncbi:DUF3501 family protein [Dokdonella sp.]|uniref:DUF3501 family protein n=1 Tax=Dokdonella sp. TaxID=2291710 RepID=UPI003C3F40A4
MQKLTRNDLYSLEHYASERGDFRTRVLAHKRNRKVMLGAHVSLLFEDRLTIQYQIQEMLRIERVFESAGIEEELDAYNPLIPDGGNLKATMLIEYDDVDMRKTELEKLLRIEDHMTACVEGHPVVAAIADEDMDRSNETKTSAVHFLRFEFTQAMIASARDGADVEFACTHPAYSERTRVVGATRAGLLADFD